jgi:hypothetical protein
MQARAVMIHRMPGGKVGASCAAMQAAAVVITECSGARKVCYPMLSCKLAAVVNALVEEGVIPALPCKLAVVIHRMLW